MSQSTSTTIITGNLGDDPKVFGNEKKVTRFDVAVTTGFGEYENTSWFPVVVFAKPAAACAQYLHKGSKVLVEGTMVQESYQTDAGETRKAWKLQARRVQFLDRLPQPEEAEEEVPF